MIVKETQFWLLIYTTVQKFLVSKIFFEIKWNFYSVRILSKQSKYIYNLTKYFNFNFQTKNPIYITDSNIDN